MVRGDHPGPLTTSYQISSVATDGAGGLWLSANNGGTDGLLFHYSGGKWTKVATPAAKKEATGVGSLAWIPGGTSLWAAGTQSSSSGTTSEGVILKYGA